MTKFNPGIALLKFAACIAVVWIHFGVSLGVFGVLLGLAVPCFMFLAVYLSAGLIVKGDWHKLGERMLRIMVPFWFWGFVCWLLPDDFHGNLHWADLVTQMTLGYPSCRPLYFMPVLAAITCVLFVAQRMKWGGTIMVVLVLLSWFLQYSGLNVKFFAPLGEIDAGCVIGRFVELLPISIAAYMFRKFRDETSMSAKRVCVTGIISITAGAVLWLVPFVRHVNGFGYCGIAPAILASGVCLLAIGGGEQLNYNGRFVKTLGALSVGIYLTHIIAKRIVACIYPMSNGPLLVACIIVVSLLITVSTRKIKMLKRLVS